MKRVFLITPSYLVKKKRDLAAGLAQLAALGFEVINPEAVRDLPTPQQKAEQMHQAFADPDVDVILAQRGGYSAMKALPFLDFDLIGKHPKILAGFSDLTALLNPIFERTGMVALHAPMLVNLNAPTDFTVRSFLNAMDGYPQKNLFRGAPVRVFHPGVASGVLKGGNFVTLTALIGTGWEIDCKGAILFLEDVDEKLHHMDRCLTQWILAGKLEGVRGIILGDFHGLQSRRIFEVLAAQLELDIPVVHCPYVGHVANKITLPVGAEVELNTETKQLIIKNLNFPGAKT